MESVDAVPHVQAWADGLAKPKLSTAPSQAGALRAAVEAADGGRMRAAYQIAGKKARGAEVASVRRDIVAAVAAAPAEVAVATSDADVTSDTVRTILAGAVNLISSLLFCLRPTLCASCTFRAFWWL